MVIPSNRTEDDFADTRWSLVQDLNALEGATSRSRLNELCLRYWLPIQQQIQDRGLDEVEANRLTGLFFEDLQRQALGRADQYRRFREFLQAELGAFLQRADSMPRGSIEIRVGSLERGFALQVIGHAMDRLQAEALAADRLPMYESLRRYLMLEPSAEDVRREAQALGVRSLFVTMAIRRLRQRFRRLVDDELLRLVTDSRELAQEREALFAALDRGR